MVPTENLVDEVWGAEKPALPNEKVWILEEKYTGQSAQSKFKDIMAKVPKDSDLLFVSSLDDIAWTLNLRGNDIEFNPLFFSYLVMHRDGEGAKADLFIREDKVADPAVREYLASINVTVHDYGAVETAFKEYQNTVTNKKLTIMPSECSAKMHAIFTELGFEIVE